MEDRAVLVRRPLLWILLLAVLLHGIGMARTPLPAQDGLKYIRVARSFTNQPWLDVVRRSDQHPLYPFLIHVSHATIEPIVGSGAVGWRLAAQLAALAASLGVLAALYDWTKHFESRRTATWACLVWLALPVPGRLGHDTLGDSLAWAAILASLTAGARWLDSGTRSAAVACGLAAGIGYLARPEVALVPLALAAVAGWRALCAGWTFEPRRLAETWVVFLCIVGAYAVVKGELSEKLSLRLAAGMGPSAVATGVPAARSTPVGLRDADWDFSAKEEDEAGGVGLSAAALRLLQATSEGLGWLGGGLAIAGLVLGRGRTGSARVVGVIFAVGFGAALIRHEARFGYLSERHAIPLVLLCLPRAAMGLRTSISRLGAWRGWSQRRRRIVRLAGVAALLATGLAIQCKPGHPSRWGHWAAGQWLREHAEVGQAVLDTRGWAGFVSGLNAYDYWHVGQALTDSRLAFVVVTREELEAASARAASLRALLSKAGSVAASFPARDGGVRPDIWIYRFRAPRSWEGVKP